MKRNEREARIKYKDKLREYFKKTVNEFCNQDMNSDLIQDQLTGHKEITSEDSSPKLLFIASDIAYFLQLSLEDFPSSYSEDHIKAHCILVDDDIDQLKKFIANVHNNIKDISGNLTYEYQIYHNKKDIADNIDELRKLVKACLEKRKLPIILLDLNLKSSNNEGLQLGESFFKLVRNEWPQIPIFALTRYRDINIILRMGQLGANGYIYKPSIGLLPLYIGLFLKEKIGEQLIGFLKHIDSEKNYTHMVIQHITAWTNMPHVLWYGDKVPIMVEHGITHASNLWSLFNSLLSVINDNKSFLLIFGDNDDCCKSNVLAFMLSLWLHDIGHKGNEDYQSGHDVRTYHGAISSSLIGARPDVYLPYFPHDKDNKLADIIERIQIYCRFHSSNGPLDVESFKKLREEGKLSEPFELGSLPIVSLNQAQSIKLSVPLSIMKDSDTSINYAIVPEEMRSSVALFRFLDALDIRANRVGDPYYLKVKQDSITREMECIFRDIVDAGNNLEIEFSRLYPTYQCELNTIHHLILEINKILKTILNYQKKLNTLRTNQEDDLLNHPFVYWGMNYWFEEKKEDIENKITDCMKTIIRDGKPVTSNTIKWRNIVDYFLMLSIQCKHFYLHKTFRDIYFEKKENNISIKYILNKPKPSEKNLDELKKWIIDCAQGISTAWAYVDKEWRKTSMYIGKSINISYITFVISATSGDFFSLPLSGLHNNYFSKVLEEVLSLVFKKSDKPIEIKIKFTDKEKTFNLMKDHRQMKELFEEVINRDTLKGCVAGGYLTD